MPPMKRLSMCALVGVVVAFGTSACKRSSETKAAPSAITSTTERAAPSDPLPRALFWSIEKDGKTSYALGTIHIGVDAKQRLPAVVWDKLDAAAGFAMEANLEDPAIANMVMCAD